MPLFLDDQYSNSRFLILISILFSVTSLFLLGTLVYVACCMREHAGPCLIPIPSLTAAKGLPLP